MPLRGCSTQRRTISGEERRSPHLRARQRGPAQPAQVQSRCGESLRSAAFRVYISDVGHLAAELTEEPPRRPRRFNAAHGLFPWPSRRSRRGAITGCSIAGESDSLTCADATTDPLIEPSLQNRTGPADRPSRTRCTIDHQKRMSFKETVAFKLRPRLQWSWSTSILLRQVGSLAVLPM